MDMISHTGRAQREPSARVLGMGFDWASMCRASRVLDLNLGRTASNHGKTACTCKAGFRFFSLLFFSTAFSLPSVLVADVQKATMLKERLYDQTLEVSLSVVLPTEW